MAKVTSTPIPLAPGGTWAAKKAYHEVKREAQAEYAEAKQRARQEQARQVKAWKKEQEAAGPQYTIPAGVELTPEEQRILQMYGPEEVNRRRRLAAEKEWAEEVKAFKEELSPEALERFERLGPEGYNEWLKATHVEVEPGVWLAKEDWKDLSAEDKKRIKTLGYEPWIAEQQAKAKAIEEELAPYKEEEGGYDVIGLYAAGYTPTKLKEMGFVGDFQESWKEWNALDPSVQDKIRKLGTEGYAQWLEDTHIVTSKGEYIPKEDIKDWDPHAKAKLVELGVEGYEAWVSAEHPPWEVAGREPTLDEYLAWKGVEPPTSLKPWDPRNVQLVAEWIWPGEQSLERQWREYEESLVKAEEEYIKLYPHLQESALKAGLLRYAGGIVPPPIPTEVVYPHISWSDISLGRKFEAGLETLGVASWIAAPIALVSLGPGALGSKALQVMKWPAITTVGSGVAAITYGAVTEVPEVDVASYEKIDLSVVGTDKASEELKPYIAPADYWGRQTLDTEAMVEAGYKEEEVTALLAQAGYKPTVPLEVYEKISPKYQPLYTPGSRTMASQPGFMGALGRGAEWVTTPARMIEGKGPGIPGVLTLGDIGAGVYGYMVPWKTFTRLYPEKGALAATTLIPHFGPTWAYTGLTWEQQPWYGKALGIGFGAAPFIGVAGGALKSKIQLKTVGLRTPIIKVCPPLTGLTRQRVLSWEAWKSLYTPKGRPLFTIPKLKLRFPIARVKVGFYKFPLKLQFPLKFTIGRGLQRAGLSAAVEKAAFEAGRAARRLAAAKAAASRIPVDIRLGKTTAWSKVASRLQHAQQASLVADRRLAEALVKAGLTPKSLSLLEKVTGQKGLESAVLRASKASTTLNKAWANVQKMKLGSPAYIKALSRLEKAQLNMLGSTSTLARILSPRFKYGPSSVFETRWQEIFREARRDVRGAREELERTSKFTPESRRAELELAVRHAESQLASLEAMYKAKVQPELSGYKMKWTRIPSGRSLYTPEGPQPAEGGFGRGGGLTEAKYRELQKMARASREAYEARVANELKAAREQRAREKAMYDAWREHKWEPGIGGVKGPSNIQEAVAMDQARLGLGVAKGPKVKVAVAEPATQLKLLQDTAAYQIATEWILKFHPTYKLAPSQVSGIQGLPTIVPGQVLPFMGLSPSLTSLQTTAAALTGGIISPAVVMTQEEFVQLVRESTRPGTYLAIERSRLEEVPFQKEYIGPAYQDYLRSVQVVSSSLGIQPLVPPGMPEWAPIPRMAVAEGVELVPGWSLTEAEVAAGVSPVAARQAAAQRLLSRQKVFAKQRAPFQSVWESPAQMLQHSTFMQTETLARIKDLADLAPVTEGLTQSLVEVTPRTQTLLRTKIQTLTRALVDTKVSIKPRTRFKFPFVLPLSTKEKRPPVTLDGLPLVATRQQGFVERAYYTDTKDIKARSTYNPEGSGKPHDVLERFGPKLGITIAEDLGHQDVFMDLDKETVRFESGGLETDVGKRHPSRTKGMTVRRKRGQFVRV